MKKLILSAIVALMSCMTMQAQENIFVIDGVQIENFDGSQLVGKKVLSHKTIERDGKTKLQIITTDAILPDSLKGKKYSVTTDIKRIIAGGQGYAELSDKQKSIVSDPAAQKVVAIPAQHVPVIYAIDGKRATELEIADLPVESLIDVKIFKAGSDKAVKLFGDEGKTHKVYLFTTKK